MTTRVNHIGRLLAATLVAVVLVGILTPLCTMPTCDQGSAQACSDFKPACDKCPEPVVMKHSSDDALTSAAPSLGQLAVVAQLAPSAVPMLLAPAPSAPVATASPPPLDPLGVRLTV